MITIKIKFPKTCGECLFYKTENYMSHNENRLECTCLNGYMKGFDMRDGNFENKKFEFCKLEDDTIVTK